MNNIELAQVWLPILDELYQQEALTSILDADENSVMVDQYGDCLLYTSCKAFKNS